MRTPTASLVVTTYNWPEALDLVLRSIAAQTERPREVLVADDGSEDPTRRLVESHQRSFPVPLRHVWQPDDGFRAGQIRNKAIAASTGAYVIQIDGDMVLHPGFVRDHLVAARPGRFIGGSRVILGPEATRRLLAGSPAPGFFSPEVRNRPNSVRAPFLGRVLARTLTPRSLKSIRGCNMSYWRSDFLAVNGYDEEFVGWGREDTDLALRLHRHGLGRTFFKLQGVAYHLHHPENSRTSVGRNDELLRRAAAASSARCRVGVNQYLGADGARPGPEVPPAEVR